MVISLEIDVWKYGENQNLKKMINLFNAHIENLSIHRVGNKSRNEAIFLSDKPYGLNDEIVPLLKEYFFKNACWS